MAEISLRNNLVWGPIYLPTPICSAKLTEHLCKQLLHLLTVKLCKLQQLSSLINIVRDVYEIRSKKTTKIRLNWCYILCKNNISMMEYITQQSCGETWNYIWNPMVIDMDFKREFSLRFTPNYIWLTMQFCPYQISILMFIRMQI